MRRRFKMGSGGTLLSRSRIETDKGQACDMRLVSLHQRLVLRCIAATAFGLACGPALAAAPDGLEERVSAAAALSAPVDRELLAPDYSLAGRDRRLAERGLTAGSPVMIRIFKQESELELWMERQGRFHLFATYTICFWSGTLGPKLREGDRQAPEGFYGVGQHQLHPQGRRPRSFDIGFPNTLDRSFGRTGSYILVHGGCSSTGCFAMTNPVMDEIYALSEHALREGQNRIEVHSFPFRMTEANLAARAESEWHAFWSSLKPAYDLFEMTHVPPRISVCDRRYLIGEAGSVGEVVAPPPDDGAPTAYSMCEDAIADIISPPAAEPQAAPRHRRIAYRPHRVAAGRNVRANYAAARRARMAAYARRMRTAGGAHD